MVRSLWLLKECLAAIYFYFQLSTVNPKLVRNDISLSTEVVTPHPRAHLSHAVGKEETHVVLNFPKQRHCLEVIILCLTTKTSNEITAETHTCNTQQRQRTAAYFQERLLELVGYRGRDSNCKGFPGAIQPMCKCNQVTAERGGNRPGYLQCSMPEPGFSVYVPLSTRKGIFTSNVRFRSTVGVTFSNWPCFVLAKTLQCPIQIHF